MHYKFLNSRDVHRVVVDGTLIVSSLSYFRGLEATAGDIGDPLEGGSEVTVRDAMVVTEWSPELEMLNAAEIGLGSFAQFAKIEGGGRINIGAGARFVHLVLEFYIYSFSSGDLAMLTEEMCVKAPLPYDACLMINDPAELGRACFQDGTIKNLGGCRVSTRFSRTSFLIEWSMFPDPSTLPRVKLSHYQTPSKKVSASVHNPKNVWRSCCATTGRSLSNGSLSPFRTRHGTSRLPSAIRQNRDARLPRQSSLDCLVVVLPRGVRE